jgi:hypothetical protein
MSVKIKRSKSRFPYGKTVSIVVAAVVLAGLAGVLGWRHFSGAQTDQPTRPTNSVDYNPPSEQEKADAQRQKDQIVQDNSKDGGEGSGTSGTLSVSIIRAGNATASEPLSVRTLVSGTTTGVCTATFTKAGQAAVTKDFPIVFEATSASCSGMDIPASSFPASGEWSMSIIAKNGSNVSAPATQAVGVIK